MPLSQKDDGMTQRVLALISDLFFAAKVEETARHLEIPLSVVGSASQLLEEVKQNRPALILIDLNADPAQSVSAITAIKHAAHPNPVRILAFLSHVQEDLAEAARRAGADAVVPRSYFSKNLPQILQGTF